jgi:hypothetical protein
MVAPNSDTAIRPEDEGSRRDIMRAFLAACFVAAVVAIVAAFVLDNYVQESSAAAFTIPGVRI